MKTNLFVCTVIIVFGSWLFQGCAASTDDESSVVIGGEVIDFTSGNAISNAVVKIISPASEKKETVSNTEGSFSFTVPADSSYDVILEASRTGLFPKRRR